MNADEIRRNFLKNAEIINTLSKRIHETVLFRGKSQKQWDIWSSACQEFHERYDALAFPGTYGVALGRIVAGHAEEIEIALCFLECRPYFFRSGYMWKELFRKIKRVPLSEEQSSRLQEVIANYQQRKEAGRLALAETDEQGMKRT